MASNKRRTGAALACLVWVSGCSASPANQAALENMKAACASGNWTSCGQIQGQEAVNRDEANRNTGMLIALPLLLPIAILAALIESEGGGSSGGGYYVSHHHGFHHGGGHHGGHR